MSLNFPNNPALNQTFTNNDVTWQWNGLSWNLVPIELPDFSNFLTADDIPEANFDVDHPVYFVTIDGEDNAERNGQSWQTSWRTIRYALSNISEPATLRIGTGTFNEQLPLIVPVGVSIVGDSQRTTIVQPADGLDIDENPNDQSTMWLLNDSTLLKGMTFTGLTGFQIGIDPQDIEDFTLGGVFVALDPAGSIINKSPYVLECSSISSGGIGAIVDGDLHSTGNKSILFHAYTCINDNGLGIWIRNAGRAEIVSCFTYFCHVGYIASSGGQIRSLNGNNSYGKYGAISSGFDTSEITINGEIYGNILEYDQSNLIGDFSTGDTITGITSESIGIITNIQGTISTIYYKLISGPGFNGGEEISNGQGASVTIDTGGISGQKGFILVASGFNERPRPGGSIEFVLGDSFTYVIRVVSGTYVNSSSILTLVLVGEKVNQSFDGDQIKIRYRYSQVRLTGHDFLNIGTGGKTTTNYPGEPLQSPSQGNEVVEQFPGRVYFVATDQDGNFRVGEFFRVDQATGVVTLNATAFDLSGLNSLRLGAVGAQVGELINEFSSDDTLAGNSNSTVPTEAAVKGYFTKVSSNIVPSANEIYDLGSETRRWRDLYLSGNTIRLGDITLKEESGNLSILTANTQTSAPLNLGNININDNTVTSIDLNGNIILDPNGSGIVSVTTNLVIDGNLTVLGASNITVDGINEVGFKNIPQNSQSVSYTLVAADAGKHILHPATDNTARTFTIPSNATTPYPIGTAITFINRINTVSVAITSDTLRLANTANTGTRTLAVNGIATAIKIDATEWIISGVGLT
jgi:hypothetical protein